MSDSFADAVARFSGEVDEAVGRARRAAAEAREQSARFRKQTRGHAEPDAEATDPELREAAVKFRTDQGLPVEPADKIEKPAPAPPVPQSGDDDDDFSQEQIMRSF